MPQRSFQWLRPFRARDRPYQKQHSPPPSPPVYHSSSMYTSPSPMFQPVDNFIYSSTDNNIIFSADHPLFPSSEQLYFQQHSDTLSSTNPSKSPPRVSYVPRRNPSRPRSNIRASDSVDGSLGGSEPSTLDNFVPHHPNYRPIGTRDFVPPLASDLAKNAGVRFSGISDRNEQPTSSPRRSGAYTVRGGAWGARFVLRRKRINNTNKHVDTQTNHAGHVEEDEYFGLTQHDDAARNSDLGKGEVVLLQFLRKTLGPKAHNFAVRLMNKTPITSSTNFTYVLHQGTEDSDLDIIRRDLTSGRLFSSGVKLIGGGWCNLLLGDRFTTSSSTRQRHELIYRRSSCTCIPCRVRNFEMVREQRRRGTQDLHDSAWDLDNDNISEEVASSMGSARRTPTHSAMANFVVKCALPSPDALKGIGASSSSRELEIGTVVRLNYRASAKLKFTDDVRELFGHFAYTGPISHEEVYRRVTTIGVHYYLYNKGKKERKVYIQGELIRLPIQVGVVKLGTQPMYFDELGATFCLYRKQIMSIYVGEIVLEGNSLGSFIKTGINYYIGFGEERGVCPVYPNKTLGKARKLGINELLLHHHMVDDLQVKCI